eukprot:gene12514-12648_t
MKLCQSLTAAVATVEHAATPPAEEGPVYSLEGYWQQQQQAQQVARTSAQHDLMLAMQEQYKCNWSDAAAAEAHQPQASPEHTLQAPGPCVLPAQQQWAAIGSSLLHHLGLVVSLVSVMVLANSSQQMLLHDLLLTWHQKQQPDQRCGLAAADCPEDLKATAENIACLQHDTTDGSPAAAAFLLLLQHLAMFYSLETGRFQQQLQITVKHSSASPTGDSIAPSSKLLTDDNNRQQMAPVDQQHLRNNYMLAEEEQQFIAAATSQYIGRLLEDTAPACYVRLLLQLVQEQKAPVHIQYLTAVLQEKDRQGRKAGSSMLQALQTQETLGAMADDFQIQAKDIKKRYKNTKKTLRANVEANAVLQQQCLASKAHAAKDKVRDDDEW